MAQSCWKLKYPPCFLFRDRLADLVIWHSATWPWLGLRVKYGKVRKLYEIGYLYAADVYNASQRLIWWANIRLNTFSHLKMYEDISWACEKCTLNDVRLALTHSVMCIHRADRKRVRGLQVFSQTIIWLKISTCRKYWMSLIHFLIPYLPQIFEHLTLYLIFLLNIQQAGLGGSVGCAVRLETRRSRVQPPPRSATFFRGDWSWNIFYGHSLPSADSRRAVVSFWRKNVHNTG